MRRIFSGTVAAHVQVVRFFPLPLETVTHLSRAWPQLGDNLIIVAVGAFGAALSAGVHDFQVDEGLCHPAGDKRVLHRKLFI